MSPIVEPSGGGYDGIEIPDGLYEVRCTKVEERDLPNDKFGNTDKFQLTLAGVTPDDEPFTVEPLMNRRWGEKSTLFGYAVAFGIDADPDMSFDTDGFIGKKAQAYIVTAEAAGSWPRVQTISRIKAGKTASARSTTTTQRSERSAIVIMEDGELDFAVFWREARRLGMTRESVAAKLGVTDMLDLTKYLASMEPTDVAMLLMESSGAT